MSTLWHWTPPSPKPYIYWFSSTAALEQSLRATWDAASWAAVLILPPIKLNSQLSSCTSFFSWQDVEPDHGVKSTQIQIQWNGGSWNLGKAYQIRKPWRMGPPTWIVPFHVSWSWAVEDLAEDSGCGARTWPVAWGRLPGTTGRQRTLEEVWECKTLVPLGLSRDGFPNACLGSSGWPKNLIDMRQINRRKSSKSLIFSQTSARGKPRKTE